jgi:hypothetical protein
LSETSLPCKSERSGKPAAGGDHVESRLFVGRFSRPFHDSDHFLKVDVVPRLESTYADVFDLRDGFKFMDQGCTQAPFHLRKQTGQLYDAVTIKSHIFAADKMHLHHHDPCRNNERHTDGELQGNSHTP